MRSTIDKIFGILGLAIAAVLAVAAGLLFWASSFIGGEVKSQFGDQHITMPPAAALTTPEMKDALGQYSGTPLDSGPKAKAYAVHFILVHMNEASGGKTYSQVSSEYQAAAKSAPDAQATKDLGNLRQTLFMGSTLRGLLLYGYAFATIGTIAMWAAWGAAIGTIVFLVLGLLGLRHGKTIAETRPQAQRVPANA
jgi:hypothetical protein